MVTAARVGPRWIDPDRVWAGTERTSATPAEENLPSEDCQIDRFHNHENMSPEALAQAVAQLQATLAIMTDRVAALEVAEATTLDSTRRLGMDVVELAGALARRVRALEQSPLPRSAAPEPAESTGASGVEVAPPALAESPPAAAPEAPAVVDVADPAPPFLFVPQPAPRKKPANGLAVALGFLLALALAVAAAAGGLWYYRSHAQTPAPSHRAAVRPIKPPASPAPSPTPAIVSRHEAPTDTHRSSPSKRDTAESAATPANAPTGHVLYGVAPSTPPAGPPSSGGARP